MEPEISSDNKGQGESAPLVPGRIIALEQNRSKALYISGICNLPFFIAIAVILSEDHDDCDEPIRAWLNVLALTFIVGIAAALIELCTGWLTKAGLWISLPFQLISLFQVAWLIVGSVWLFSDDNCENDWYDGYVLSLVILIFFYVFIGLAIVAVCCGFCCAGVFAGIAGASLLRSEAT